MDKKVADPGSLESMIKTLRVRASRVGDRKLRKLTVSLCDVLERVARIIDKAATANDWHTR